MGRFNSLSYTMDKGVHRQESLVNPTLAKLSLTTKTSKESGLVATTEKLSVMEAQTKEFYAACAKEEFNKITKKHSFRSFVN